jgi:ParB family chromosome partitioning protein
LIETNQLSTGHAKVILGISNSIEQQRIAHLVVSRNLSVRETEKVLESTVITRKRSTKELRRSPLSDVEERLQKRLGTKVTILSGRRGGKVIIHYFSPAELDGILESILQ